MKTITWILSSLVSAALLLGSPGAASASEPTTAQGLRAALTPERLQEIRSEMAAMRSGNRWPGAQQDRYVQVCLRHEANEPSLNPKTCGCELEVMMDKYVTFGDLVNDLMNHGGQPDERTAGLIGMCLVSFGD